MSKLLRSLTKNERMRESLTFLTKYERFAPKFDERIPNPAQIEGAVTRDFFCPCLFHESKTSGPLIKNSFCEDIREISDSAQANTERSRKLKCLQIQNWLALRRVGLCAGNQCAETNFFLYILENLHFQGI